HTIFSRDWSSDVCSSDLDLFLLHGDEDDVDVVAGSGGGQRDVIEVDVVDVKGDVLFGFPLDRLGELLRRHGRKRDLLDDDRVARSEERRVGKWSRGRRST